MGAFFYHNPHSNCLLGIMGLKSFFFLLGPLLPLILVAHPGYALDVGFYDNSCPWAEVVVNEAVQSAVAANPGIAAGLIRMHFHDCFVRGCDGSVLIDSTGSNKAEKDSPPNFPSLRGFEVVDAAKAVLEEMCPNTVSCADILAFAARDSAALVGDIIYEVPAGRRDGRVSIFQEALDNLPGPGSNINELISKFAVKGLNELDMVTLSGAHSIGVSHCSSFLGRIYNSSSPTGVDPTLNPRLASALRTVCPQNVPQNDGRVVNMDTITPDVLDNKYYVGLTRNLGLFTSDFALLTKDTSYNMVMNNIKDQPRWKQLFAQAMVKMGNIQVLTGNQGEIRKNCHVVNRSKMDLLLPVPAKDSGVAATLDLLESMATV